MQFNTADTIIRGKIYTADPEGSFAEAMAIAGGRLLCVGSAAEAERYRGPETAVLEKQGLIVPGMTEGHAHVSCTSEMLYGIALGIREDPQEYLDIIRAWMEAHPDEERIFGSGYDNGVFPAGGPNAALLDTVSTEKPIVMVASDHHSRWLNSKALELCGITRDTPNPRNGEVVKDPVTGEPTGWLKEQAMNLANPAVPVFTPAHYAAAVACYQGIALENGITNVFEPIYDPTHDYEARSKGWGLLDSRGELYLTGRLGWTIANPEEIPGTLDAMRRVDGELAADGNVRITTAKFFVDGVVECHTAVLREDYADAPGDRGTEIMSTAEFAHGMTEALRRGMDIHVHVIGDRASDICIDAMEQAQKTAAAEGRTDFRNAMTHLQLLWPDQADRMAALGITAVVNPYWHYYSPVYYEALELPYLGEYRASHEYPVRMLLDKGIAMSQASDFPVTVPPASLTSLHLMVNRIDPDHSEYPPQNPGERLTVREAMDVLTIGGARQLRLERDKGSLEAGKCADFAVLSEDVFEIDPLRLAETKVNETWIGGICRYERG